MKKLLSMGLVLALELSLSVTTFAANSTITPGTNAANTSIDYQVDPAFSVTIPAEVTLGQTATVSASGVVVEKGSQVEVSLTGTSGTGNTFQLKTAEGAELNYTIKAGETEVSLNDKVLTVNPTTSNNGSTTLSFMTPDNVTFAGKYTGTVTFTVSVQPESAPN